MRSYFLVSYRPGSLFVWLVLLLCRFAVTSGQFCTDIHNSTDFRDDVCCNRDIDARFKCVNDELCFGVAISHPIAILSGCCEDYPSCGATHSMFEALDNLKILSTTDFGISMFTLVMLAIKYMTRFLIFREDDEQRRKWEDRCNWILAVCEIINFGFGVATIVVIQSSKALATANDLLDAECFPGSRNGKTVGDVVNQLDSYYTIAIIELVIDFSLAVIHFFASHQLRKKPDSESHWYHIEFTADIGEVADAILAFVKLFLILYPTIQQLEELYSSLALLPTSAQATSGCILSCCLGSILKPSTAVSTILPSNSPSKQTDAPLLPTSSALTLVPSFMPSAVPPTNAPVQMLPEGCFSGENEVEVLSKGRVKMQNLQLGDMVRVRDNRYERVYSFGHRDESGSSGYMQIVTDGQREPL
mmetsp:Transcript_35413/g.50219  ORF Transcript_35413/g.50219 Transcript_35413/m.50219 type:complete len:417 (+) Transcript_35413:402-1652(+)